METDWVRCPISKCKRRMRRNEFAGHVRRRHRNWNIQAMNTPIRKEFGCPFCASSFVAHHTLQRHIISSHGPIPGVRIHRASRSRSRSESSSDSSSSDSSDCTRRHRCRRHRQDGHNRRHWLHPKSCFIFHNHVLFHTHKPNMFIAIAIKFLFKPYFLNNRNKRAKLNKNKKRGKFK